MEEYTKKTNFTGLSMIKDQWEDDRKQARRVYREAIENLAKCEYDILTARTLIANDKTDPTWIEQFYGVHQAKFMRKEAWKSIKEAKKRRAAINMRIQMSTKEWVQRNTIFALKARRAYQWANELITKNIVEPNPELAREKFESHNKWREAVNTAKNSADIKFSWRDPRHPGNDNLHDESTTEKQSVIIAVSWHTWQDNVSKYHNFVASF